MFKTLDMMKKGDQKGFTLIELLIVIAIIAILAAIAIPQYSQYRLKAAQSTAVAGITQCTSEMMALYANDGSTANKACDVGSTSVTVNLDINNSAVDFTPKTVSVSGQSVTCQMVNNVIGCP